MEGAVRVFAAEFNRSTLTVPDGNDSGSAWVVTPSGGYCRQVFLAGALTEVHEQGDILAFRVADPTGGFDLVCGGKNAELPGSIRKIPLPSFVSVSGRAQLYRREGTPVLTIRPDSVRVIDRRIRDQWVITTAAATLARLELVHQALNGTCTDSRILVACTHYSLTRKDLVELAGLAAGALSGVRSPEETETGVQQEGARELVMAVISTAAGPHGVSVEEVIGTALLKGFSREAVLAVIESLIVEDECYQPRKGYVRLL